MDQKTTLGCLLGLLLMGACQGPSSNSADEPGTREAGVIRISQNGAKEGQINFRDPLYRRFTDRFEAPAVLIADRIEVQGPSDLLEHLALRQDSPGFDSSMRTTREGLRQELTRVPGVVGGEAFAQLDKWKLYALHKMIITQAPDDQPVRILAFGQAVYVPGGDTSKTVKKNQMNFIGEHGQN